MRSAMAPHIDAGNDVLLVVHSHAGFPGAAALSAQSKRDREARGVKGGIVGVVFLAAFIPLAGDTLHTLLQNKWEPWMVPKVRPSLCKVHPLTV